MLADGFAYVELGLQRGLDANRFASGLSFFFDAHIDFFEKIGEVPGGPPHLGAMAARPLRGDRPACAKRLRFHTQTAGLAHRPATHEQRGPHRRGGAGRRAGGDESTRTRSTRCSHCRPRMRRRSPSGTEEAIVYESGVTYVVGPRLPTSWRRSPIRSSSVRRLRRSSGSGTAPCSKVSSPGSSPGWFTKAIAEASFDEQRPLRGRRPRPGGRERLRRAGRAPAETLRILSSRPSSCSVRRSPGPRPASTAGAERALAVLTDAARDPDRRSIRAAPRVRTGTLDGGEVTAALQQPVFGAWRETPAFDGNRQVQPLIH